MFSVQLQLRKEPTAATKLSMELFVATIALRIKLPQLPRRPRYLRLLKRSLPKLNATKAHQLLEESNILLKTIATNLGINVEEPHYQEILDSALAK